MLAPVPYGVDDINDAAAVHNPLSTVAISGPIELGHERTPSSRCELPAQGNWDGIDTNLELDIVGQNVVVLHRSHHGLIGRLKQAARGPITDSQ